MKVPTLGTSVFSPVARTGTGAAANITGVGFPTDLALIQKRTGASAVSFDRLRGATRSLFPPYTDGEAGSASELTSFASMDGYSLGTSIRGSTNAASDTYINWNFRRAPGFFDEVCYTGTGSATTFSHNLQAVPELMIVKQRDDTGNWCVYTAATAPTNVMYLNTTNASFGASGFWNNTAPTASVFTIGNNGNVNNSASTYVAHLFASAPGVSKVGTYTGTGAAQTINCGFVGGSRVVMIKRTDSTGDWYVWDSARGIVAGNDPYLLINSTAAEVTSTDYIDTYSAGFEISSTAPAAINASAGSFIFLAIA
jgi:hypothetical protein